MRRVLLAVVLLVCGVLLGIALRHSNRRSTDPDMVRADEEETARPFDGGGRRPASRALPSVPTAAEQPSSSAPEAAGPGVEPAPAYRQRPPGEWQGMLVNLAIHPECTSSSGCGLARACREGRCWHCLADGDCAPGEVCVLDLCLRSENVTCKRRSDCPEGQLCALSGFSPDPRNNGLTRSFCSGSAAPRKQEWKPPPVDDSAREVPPAIDGRDLLRQLKSRAADGGA